jgi:hypothetical protein
MTQAALKFTEAELKPGVVTGEDYRILVETAKAAQRQLEINMDDN